MGQGLGVRTRIRGSESGVRSQESEVRGYVLGLGVRVCATCPLVFSRPLLLILPASLLLAVRLLLCVSL